LAQFGAIGAIGAIAPTLLQLFDFQDYLGGAIQENCATMQAWLLRPTPPPWNDWWND
jgi:hypothetical protein